jgi:ribosomal protein S18 acetylase RimI-like enzyme
MIRPTIPEETPTLLAIAESTGVFSPLDMKALREVLDDYFQGRSPSNLSGTPDCSMASGAGKDTGTHCLVSYEQDGQVIGFAYYATAAMTDRTWYLWWIAVSKQVQARGVGKQLLRYLEEDIRNERGRLLVLETSSLDSYKPTRDFYLRNGYEQAAEVKDYYADGHHMVVFRKRLGH